MIQHGAHVPRGFRAACATVEFGLSPDESRQAIHEWNETHCEPKWSNAALEHKLRGAFATATPKPEFANGSDAPGVTKPGSVTRSPSRPTAPIVQPLDFRACNLTAGTPGQIVALATSRRISTDGVRLAVERALLRFGQYRQHHAWFSMDTRRRFAVARRLDGELWFGDVKALTMSSEPPANGAGVWPIGILESRNYQSIAIVEGGPDLLAAHHFIVKAARQQDCAAVMMFSSAPQIHVDALPHFTGKRVRIFTHTDDNGAGEKATERWAGQLENIGVTVDGYRCGSAACRDRPRGIGPA